MRELSLNILDIVQNSIQANSSTVEIDIKILDNLLTICIIDDGVGMNSDMLKSVTDPFTTSRTTRKVGLGIPLFKMSSENSGGNFSIQSQLNKGTTVRATFVVDNIDRPPLGDIASTFSSLIYMNSSIRYILKYSYNNKSFTVDTKEIELALDNVPITEYEVIKFIEDMIKENIQETGGIL